MTAERVRLFVALELPGDIRRELVRWRTPLLQGAEGVRAVSLEDLHVTLCFLGWKELSELDAVAAACDIARGRGPVDLALGEAALLPRRRPRVLAVSLEDRDGALEQLQGSLSASLEDGGWFEPEERPFYGHVTVARAGRGARVPRSTLTEPPPAPLRFEASHVTLYRSHLRRSGASYQPVARVELGSAGDRL